MTILADLLFVCLMVFAAYTGTRRGAVLIGLEFACFVLASLIGLLTYHGLGSWLTSLGLSRTLGNVAAFTIMWVVVELAAALVIRLTILKHLNRDVQLARWNQIGGSFLNVVKATFLTGLALITLAALPVPQAAKAIVTDSFIGKRILASTTNVQAWLSAGLGHDLSDSLNFYTISAEPQSTEHIDLGFTTTATKIDEPDETAMVGLINQERTSRGLQPLTMNLEARTVARAYSLLMLKDGYFSHIDPDGHTPFQRLTAAGVLYHSAGENLALAPTLALAHQGLMNSPGHRANILSTSYHTVGIGIIDAGQYGLMVTQEFTD